MIKSCLGRTCFFAASFLMSFCLLHDVNAAIYFGHHIVNYSIYNQNPLDPSFKIEDVIGRSPRAILEEKFKPNDRTFFLIETDWRARKSTSPFFIDQGHGDLTFVRAAMVTENIRSVDIVVFLSSIVVSERPSEAAPLLAKNITLKIYSENPVDEIISWEITNQLTLAPQIEGLMRGFWGLNISDQSVRDHLTSIIERLNGGYKMKIVFKAENGNFAVMNFSTPQDLSMLLGERVKNTNYCMIFL